MIVFQLLGLLAVSGFCVWIGLIGLAQMFYNGIGGAGSKTETFIGFVIAVIGFGAVVFLWAEYSSLRLVVQP